jgi:hypothetical protein
MHMKMMETFRKARTAFRVAWSSVHEEDARCKIRGDVFITMRDGQTGLVQEHRELRNLVVRDASILIARLMKDNQEPPKGGYVLAVGAGDSGWDPMAPPAPTDTQRSLYSEITRKTFSNTQFVDSGGIPVAYPTNIVDFTTIFTESEAVGPLVEMGLIGGNIDSNLSIKNPYSPANGPYDPTVDLTAYETLINYLCFAVVNKPATSTLEVVWRLQF